MGKPRTFPSGLAMGIVVGAVGGVAGVEFAMLCRGQCLFSGADNSSPVVLGDDELQDKLRQASTAAAIFEDEARAARADAEALRQKLAVLTGQPTTVPTRP